MATPPESKPNSKKKKKTLQSQSTLIMPALPSPYLVPHSMIPTPIFSEVPIKSTSWSTKSYYPTKASPVFKTMFSLPQPTTDSAEILQESRAIVVLAEHSNILAALLLTIYPPTLMSVLAQSLSLSDHIAILDMARKYDMAATSCRLLIT